MKVILIQDVQGLGKSASLVKVKDGFAHNFLIPKKLALPATQANIKILEQQKQKKAQESEKLHKQAQALKEKLDNLSLTIPALTQDEDKEKLYGSISVQDIADALKEEGFEIDKGLIMLEQSIRSLGIYEIPLKLHPEVSAKIKIWVVKK